jgi:hypothetical protein
VTTNTRFGPDKKDEYITKKKKKKERRKKTNNWEKSEMDNT